MAFEYRYATKEDLDQIVAIEQSSMPNPWTLKSYIEAIDSDHAFILVAVDVDTIVGFAVFYLTPPESELPDIVVASKNRGQGIGKNLLAYAKSELTSNGIDTVFLEVRVSNAPARKLYEGFGFEEIGKRKYFYSNPIEDAICMALHMEAD